MDLYRARRGKVQDAMRERGVDLLAVAPGENLYYLLGYSPIKDERPCFLLITTDASGCLIPTMNAGQAREQADIPIRDWDDAQGPGDALDLLVEDLGLPRVKAGLLSRARVPVTLVDDTMRADFLLTLKRSLGGVEVGLASQILGSLRMSKSAEEQDLLVRSASLADQAMEAAFRACHPGATEKEVGDATAAAFTAVGADEVDFTIVAAGPNSAFPHHQTSRRRLEAGDAVIIDIGAKFGRYCSDITRMALLGEPPDEYLAVHATVEAAVQAALARVFPGGACSAVDQAAREVITRAGYGEYFTHRTGHGIGLTGHEPPWITSTEATVLQPGMTFSIEPGIYLPGRFGVRLEEIVIVTPDGPRILSGLTREVRRIPG